MSAHARLRAATAADHAATDAVFGDFDIGKPEGYRTYLRAHARALPVVERMVSGDMSLPSFRPRAEILYEDLRRVGASTPPPIDIADPETSAERLGILYVMEGSRLGGGMLAKQVGAGLPHAYLSATHLSGEWRAFCQRLDAADQGEAWFAEVLSGARTAFAAYARAAMLERAVDQQADDRASIIKCRLETPSATLKYPFSSS